MQLLDEGFGKERLSLLVVLGSTGCSKMNCLCRVTEVRAEPGVRWVRKELIVR